MNAHNLQIMRKAVGRVCAFFMIFKSNISTDDLQKYLEIRINKNEFLECLKEIPLPMPIEDRDHPENAIRKKLWKKVKRYSPFFRHLPFVKFAAVCNNLAFNCATESSDIDLFIVAEGQDFTVRFLRRHCYLLEEETRQKGCCRLLLLISMCSEDALGLDVIRIRNDVYLDFWLASLFRSTASMMGRIAAENQSTFRKFPNLRTGKMKKDEHPG